MPTGSRPLPNLLLSSVVIAPTSRISTFFSGWQYEPLSPFIVLACQISKNAQFTSGMQLDLGMLSFGLFAQFSGRVRQCMQRSGIGGWLALPAAVYITPRAGSLDDYLIRRGMPHCRFPVIPHLPKLRALQS